MQEGAGASESGVLAILIANHILPFIIGKTNVYWLGFFLNRMVFTCIWIIGSEH